MNKSLQALLGGIVDYAGLFPPAQLTLDTAIRNYARYRAQPESWMLGRFIIPAARLGELTPLGKELFTTAAPFSFSILGRGGKAETQFLAAVNEDLADVARFCESFGERVAVDAFELKLPTSAFSPVKPSQLSSLIAATASLIEGTVLPNLAPFFESPVTERTALLAVIEALANDRRSKEAAGRKRCRPAGFKVRTGGLEASAFPSVEQVALALTACRAAQVAFKATAGLHHPIRRFDAGVQAKMHGFLNVFGGGCLAHALNLTEGQLAEIIADENPANFALDGESFRWRDRRIDSVALANARRELVTSFGSCSFDEPCEDLRAMKWLP